MPQYAGSSAVGRSDAALERIRRCELNAPMSLERADSFRTITPLPSQNLTDPLEDILSGPLPQVLSFEEPVTTPPLENMPLPSMDSLVGTNVAPVAPIVAPTFPIETPTTKFNAATGLRLPSFETLGIANPHPDRPHGQVAPTSRMSPLRQISSDAVPVDVAANMKYLLPVVSPLPVGARTIRASSLGTPNVISSSIQQKMHSFETITPPEDGPEILWDSLARKLGDDDIVQMNDERQSTPIAPTTLSSASNTPLEIHAPTTSTNLPRFQVQRTRSDQARSIWLDDAATMILTNLRTAEVKTNPIRVLSHALPCPSPTGFAFPFLINSLQTDTPSSPLCWINVFHAVPGRFNMGDLPTSPPNTPGLPLDGNDYFTSKTFDSAVPVLDYQDNLTSMPKTPHPIVPPATISVSVLERYIPPSNTKEFSEMFKIDGRSLLVDRLLELSPDNGSLLFIYPTKTGAEVFSRQYLGPVLDPLLRSMQTIHQLPYDLASQLGSSPAVESMLSFQDLQAGLVGLCKELSTSNTVSSLFQARKANYVLELATTYKVKLERGIWADKWWIKQEKTRVKDTVMRYFGGSATRGSGLSMAEQSGFTPTSLIHGILDGVATRPYEKGREPIEGVEVGMFIVRRTA